MYKRFLLALLALGLNLYIPISDTGALAPSVVISHVQAGGASGLDQAALQEIVIIYNNSASDIEITNWCVQNKSSVKFACFEPSGPSLHLWIGAHSYASLSSVQFNTQYSFTPDVAYSSANLTSGSITSSSDTISLIDSSSTVVDSISWSSTLSGGYHYERISSGEILQDTGQLTDFTKSITLVIPASGVYEVLVVVDQCPNIDLVQESIPLGYLKDELGNCQVDVCSNLSGLQTEVPPDKKLDGSGGCVDIDVCINISGAQKDIPSGYYKNEFDECFVITSPLKINEMLPNSAGKDSGNEFIELYNPTDLAVGLDLYKFTIGVESLRSYNFPIGAVVEPRGYYVLYNSAVSFTLNNTASKINLETIDNQTVDTSDSYFNAKESEAWALIDGLWQYTNQLTPGSENLPRVESEVEIVSNLVPCGPNQYRNPETNRCRSVITKTSTLKPCADNEYRSEETGRCRSVLGASTTAPEACPEGQYRNPDTNRCRKIVSLTKLDYPSEVPLTVSGGEYGVALLSGATIFLLAYGLFEWREEITNVFKRIVRFLRSGRL